MLSVIIDARTGDEGLPGLLGQLTSGVVQGLVRQVAIVATAGPGLEALCEETGADLHATLQAAAQAARSERLLVMPAELRLRDGWIGSFEAHLAQGGGEAVVQGLADGGLFARRPFGVLVERSRLDRAGGADLKRLRRGLGLGARRLG
jgi:hypothetical protein